MSKKPLVLEVLNGPLDGQLIRLETDSTWGKTGLGPLAFPWDEKLGSPQAHFFIEEATWLLESYDNTPHGTYALGDGERVTEKLKLEANAQEKSPGLVHRDLKPGNILVAQGGLATVVQRASLQLATLSKEAHPKPTAKVYTGKKASLVRHPTWPQNNGGAVN